MNVIAIGKYKSNIKNINTNIFQDSIKMIQILISIDLNQEKT